MNKKWTINNEYITIFLIVLFCEKPTYLLLGRTPTSLKQLRCLVRVDKAVEPLLLQQVANAFEKLFDRIHWAEPVHTVAEALERNGIVKRIADNGTETLEMDVTDEFEIETRLFQKSLFELFVRHFLKLASFPQLLANATAGWVRAREFRTNELLIFQYIYLFLKIKSTITTTTTTTTS